MARKKCYNTPGVRRLIAPGKGDPKGVLIRRPPPPPQPEPSPSQKTAKSPGKPMKERILEILKQSGAEMMKSSPPIDWSAAKMRDLMRKMCDGPIQRTPDGPSASPAHPPMLQQATIPLTIHVDDHDVTFTPYMTWDFGAMLRVLVEHPEVEIPINWKKPNADPRLFLELTRQMTMGKASVNPNEILRTENRQRLVEKIRRFAELKLRVLTPLGTSIGAILMPHDEPSKPDCLEILQVLVKAQRLELMDVADPENWEEVRRVLRGEADGEGGESRDLRAAEPPGKEPIEPKRIAEPEVMMPGELVEDLGGKANGKVNGKEKKIMKKPVTQVPTRRGTRRQASLQTKHPDPVDKEHNEKITGNPKELTEPDFTEPMSIFGAAEPDSSTATTGGPVNNQDTFETGGAAVEPTQMDKMDQDLNITEKATELMTHLEALNKNPMARDETPQKEGKEKDPKPSETAAGKPKDLMEDLKKRSTSAKESNDVIKTTSGGVKGKKVQKIVMKIMKDSESPDVADQKKPSTSAKESEQKIVKKNPKKPVADRKRVQGASEAGAKKKAKGAEDANNDGEVADGKVRMDEKVGPNDPQTDELFDPRGASSALGAASDQPPQPHSDSIDKDPSSPKIIEEVAAPKLAKPKSRTFCEAVTKALMGSDEDEGAMTDALGAIAQSPKRSKGEGKDPMSAEHQPGDAEPSNAAKESVDLEEADGSGAVVREAEESLDVMMKAKSVASSSGDVQKVKVVREKTMKLPVGRKRAQETSGAGAKKKVKGQVDKLDVTAQKKEQERAQRDKEEHAEPGANQGGAEKLTDVGEQVGELNEPRMEPSTIESGGPVIANESMEHKGSSDGGQAHGAAVEPPQNGPLDKMDQDLNEPILSEKVTELMTHLEAVNKNPMARDETPHKEGKEKDPKSSDTAAKQPKDLEEDLKKPTTSAKDPENELKTTSGSLKVEKDQKIFKKIVKKPVAGRKRVQETSGAGTKKKAKEAEVDSGSARVVAQKEQEKEQGGAHGARGAEQQGNGVDEHMAEQIDVEAHGAILASLEQHVDEENGLNQQMMDAVLELELLGPLKTTTDERMKPQNCDDDRKEADQQPLDGLVVLNEPGIVEKMRTEGQANIQPKLIEPPKSFTELPIDVTDNNNEKVPRGSQKARGATSEQKPEHVDVEPMCTEDPDDLQIVEQTSGDQKTFLILGFSFDRSKFPSIEMIQEHLERIGAPPIKLSDIEPPSNHPFGLGGKSPLVFGLRFNVKGKEANEALLQYMRSGEYKQSFKMFLENDSTIITENWDTRKLCKVKMIVEVSRMKHAHEYIESLEKLEETISTTQFQKFCVQFRDSCLLVFEQKLNRRYRNVFTDITLSFTVFYSLED